jgi:hypothetical protein
MKISNAFLANYGEVHDSLAFISGAFPEWWYVTDLTQRVPMRLVVQLQFNDSELDTPFDFQIALRQGSRINPPFGFVKAARQRSDLDVVDAPKFQIWTMAIEVSFFTSGLHEIVISNATKGSQREELASIPVLIRTNENISPT